ncbi:MAG: hypothetical protein U9N43_09350 [Euryarchaeota archaeon]|nr:hypothetical protein [Euryarchaeota archaeon]
MATIADADVLVSWNLPHIVYFDKIWQFNVANLERGYKMMVNYSLIEVTTWISENG